VNFFEGKRYKIKILGIFWCLVFSGVYWADNLLSEALRCFNPYRLTDTVERIEGKLQFEGG